MSDEKRPFMADSAPLDCEAVRQLVPAYSLGALDADERARFEAALPGCPSAAAELGDYQRVAGALLSAAPQVDAPPSARARLLASLDDAATPTPTLRTARPTASAPRRRWLWPLAAAAFALLLGGNLYFASRLAALEGRQAGPEALVDDLGTGALNRLDLISTRGVEGQVGRLGWVPTPDGESWVAWLVVDNLPVLTEGEAYTLWLAREGEPAVNVGQFNATSALSTAFVFLIGEPIEGYDQVYVTRAPRGSAQPGDEPVIAADI